MDISDPEHKVSEDPPTRMESDDPELWRVVKRGPWKRPFKEPVKKSKEGYWGIPEAQDFQRRLSEWAGRETTFQTLSEAHQFAQHVLNYFGGTLDMSQWAFQTPQDEREFRAWIDRYFDLRAGKMFQPNTEDLDGVAWETNWLKISTDLI